MTILPFVPAHLTVIPPAPRSGDDPEADDRRAAYREWRHAIHPYRVERQHILKHHADLIPLEKYYCEQSFAYWLTIYGTIFEPRQDRNELGGGNLPFIPFSKQIDLAEFLLGTLTAKGAKADAVVSKTRDVGASWMICALALWGWLFRSPWNVLLVSRKEDLVDSKNQRSLFAKIDRMLWNLPDWMRPFDYNTDKHRMKLFMVNPDNLNEIAGESTTSKTGRGDRSTWTAFDEAAFIPQLFDTWNGVAATTSHRWAISTESLDEGMDFYNLRTGEGMDDKPSLFELDWFDNPLNDEFYIEDQKIRYASRPSDFEREILRNPHAGMNTFVYGKLQDPKYDPDPRWNTVDPMAPTYLTIDPGKLDETAIVIIQENMATLETVILDSYQNKGKDADFYGTLLAGVPDEDRFAGMYGEREWALVELIRQLPAPTYTGDIYGDTSNGVTLETFYSVIGKYKNPQGEHIMVNRSRANVKDRGMYTRSRLTSKGRQQSLHELIDGLRFSTRPGAVFAFKCLKNHRFKNESGLSISESSAPIHDWTSHITQAIEFYAIHKATRGKLKDFKPKPTQQLRQAPSVARLIGPGATRQRSTLYARK